MSSVWGWGEAGRGSTTAHPSNMISDALTAMSPHRAKSWAIIDRTWMAGLDVRPRSL